MIPSQILVHIGAPSTAQDDARYRAQVAAILEFQCASRQPLEIEPSGPTDRDPHLAEDSSVPATTQHEASPILREALRPAYTTLFSDRHLGPEREGATPREHIISNHSSLESLISVIPDSQPEIAQLVYASPSHAALSPPSLTPPPKRRRTAPASPDQANPIPIHENHAAADQPASHRVSPFQNQDGRLPTGFPETPIQISSSEQGKGPDYSVSHSTPSLPIHAIPLTPNPITLSTLPLEIHPPRPPISTSTFTTHITPTLSMLVERLNPARTYNPSTQSRHLDPLERGYWLVRLAIEPPQQPIPDHVDLPTPSPNPKPGTTSPMPNPKPSPEEIRTWPSPLFHAFWSFLSDFVGRDGRAGWGVWCILEAATPPSTVLSDTHLTLKVYTWGEVAMHVYLLLFLASERRIRGMGAQWRDSREEIVIQMP